MTAKEPALGFGKKITLHPLSLRERARVRVICNPNNTPRIPLIEQSMGRMKA
jgi:hypothetical protein